MLVVALNERVARWARRPVALGPGGSVFRAITAIAPLDDAQRSRAYFDLLRYHVGEALDRALERLMATTEHKYLSDFARKYYDEGEAKGKLEGEAQGLRAAITALFSVRQLSLSDGGRARIAACTDIATLTRWHERAATASAEPDVFGA